MDGDYVYGLLAGTAGLDFGVPGLNAGFFETLCGAGGAGCACLAAMFRDRAAGMHSFGNGCQFGPAEGGGGELAAVSREGSSVSDPAWAYGANAKKRKVPAAGAAKGKEVAATFAKVTPEFGLQMGEVTGPDSKKCKFEDETVRPKVEEEAATTSDGSAGGESGRKQAKGKGSKSKQPYMQRFDPGFGCNGGAYTIQPLYAPAVTYNTEFPQLGSPQMSHVPVEQQQPHPMAQHMSGPWSPAQSPNAIGMSLQMVLCHP
ncbi:hypothetical protein ZWY2020_059132 [Hordeum vulgare]|nr:hypothetical protein ZWY2020_059132 [Hordeum vulgare]